MEQSPRTLAELSEEHETLRMLMRDHALRMAGLKAPDDAFITALPDRRLQFRELLRRHAREEESAVAKALVQARPDEGEALALIFPLGMRGVFNQYDRLADEWPVERIRGEWPRYRESVLALQRQLAERMAWEEREVYLHLI